MRAPREAWRRIGPTESDAAGALARAVAVLDALGPDGPPAMAWPVVTPPALVVGRAAGAPAVDWDACRAAGVAVHQRASGGGPVLWDAGLVAVDVILPRGHALLPGDVVAAYRWVGQAVAAALNGLGVPARAVPPAEARARPPGGAAATCFGGLSPWEVVGPDGRKACGLSQVRRRSGALIQAGIALDLDAPGLASLVGGGPALAGALASAAAGVREWRPGLGADELMGALEAALIERAGASLVTADLTAPERAAARSLTTGRFSPIARPPGGR